MIYSYNDIYYISYIYILFLSLSNILLNNSLTYTFKVCTWTKDSFVVSIQRFQCRKMCRFILLPLPHGCVIGASQPVSQPASIQPVSRTKSVCVNALRIGNLLLARLQHFIVPAFCSLKSTTTFHRRRRRRRCYQPASQPASRLAGNVNRARRRAASKAEQQQQWQQKCQKYSDKTCSYLCLLGS